MTARPFDHLRAANSARSRIDFAGVASTARRHSRAVCNRIIPGGKILGHEYVVLNPKRADRTPGSFRVNLRTGKWADFATGDKGGDLISLIAWRFDINQVEAARRLASLLSISAEVSR
jgi:hypothetical protein